jgi:hypothetical protein
MLQPRRASTRPTCGQDVEPVGGVYYELDNRVVEAATEIAHEGVPYSNDFTAWDRVKAG